MTNKKLTNILLIVLPAVAAVLTALPWCVRLRFAAGPEEIIYEYFSGFSLIPVGYAIWSPMLAGLFAIVLTVMGLVYARKEDPRMLKWMMILAVVGLMMSVTTLALGVTTAVSALVALAIGADAAMLYRLREDM